LRPDCRGTFLLGGIGPSWLGCLCTRLRGAGQATGVGIRTSMQGMIPHVIVEARDWTIAAPH